MKTDEQQKPLFDALVQSSRKLELDYEQACAGASENAARVRATVAAFLDGYAAFNKITKEAALASYMATIRRYANDIRAYIGGGKYPLELDPTQAMLSRMDYDLFLILTILVTKHRCAIMEELLRFPAAGKALVIGEVLAWSLVWLVLQAAATRMIFISIPTPARLFRNGTFMKSCTAPPRIGFMAVSMR